VARPAQRTAPCLQAGNKWRLRLVILQKKCSGSDFDSTGKLTLAVPLLCERTAGTGARALLTPLAGQKDTHLARETALAAPEYAASLGLVPYTRNDNQES
jgi:hypothetical protein